MPLEQKVNRHHYSVTPYKRDQVRPACRKFFPRARLRHALTHRWHVITCWRWTEPGMAAFVASLWAGWPIAPPKSFSRWLYQERVRTFADMSNLLAEGP